MASAHRMPTTRLRPLERQNERRLRTSYIFSADFFFLRINRSRKSDVFEIFSKTKTAARADLVGRYSVDQDLNLILGPRWRPGPKFNMDHINSLTTVDFKGASRQSYGTPRGCAVRAAR